MGEFPVGRCSCGAVYTSDATGFNVGAAMVDCLVYACAENWELAWDLLPGDDYLTGRIERYDEQGHQVVETGNLDGRIIRGVLYFIRLHKDISDLARSLQEKKTVERSVAAPESAGFMLEPERDPKRVKRRASKEMVRSMAEARDINGLVDLCFDDKRTVRFLQRLLFDPDPGKRWLFAYVMGQVFGRVSTRLPGMVSDLLHRLFESCADSASANWGAIEAIGEIIRARPDLYGPFSGHLMSFAGSPLMRLETLWALGTIAGARPELIRAMPFYKLSGYLVHEDPSLRGHVVRLYGRIRAKELQSHIEKLVVDPAHLVVYEDGEPHRTDVGSLAREALANIRDQGEKK